MSDSTSDSPKPSDRFGNSETKSRNRETCLEAGFTVSSVDHRYKHTFSIVFAKPCDSLDNLKLYSVFESGFLIHHALIVSTSDSATYDAAGASAIVVDFFITVYVANANETEIADVITSSLTNYKRKARYVMRSIYDLRRLA